jgi:hypothetical protein
VQSLPGFVPWRIVGLGRFGITDEPALPQQGPYFLPNDAPHKYVIEILPEQLVRVPQPLAPLKVIRLPTRRATKTGWPPPAGGLEPDTAPSAFSKDSFHHEFHHFN